MYFSAALERFFYVVEKSFQLQKYSWYYACLDFVDYLRELLVF